VSLPRLLAGARSRALSRAEHEAVHGPPQAAGGAAELVGAVGAAGLRGRGGASFASALKLGAAAGERGPRAVLVNGAEGEPMSAKDRTLMAHVPHLVLDGALAAAAAIGARDIVVAVREDAGHAHAAMLGAVAERDDPASISVVDVPAAYLAGEETALVHLLNGGPLTPTVAPPRPAQRGLRGRPTLVHNPETLAHIALIDRHGPDWFRELGTEAHPGSTLITVAGAVRDPSVIEIECGAPLEQVLAAAGGAGEPLRAVLIGGYHGTWIPAQDIPATTLDNECLARLGGGIGAGVVMALPATACPAAEVAATVGWLAQHSARQCGPCRNGLPALAGLLDAVVAGRAADDHLQQLERWSAALPGRGACGLPDGAVRFLASALRVFPRELADHARHGPCDACRRPRTLHLPPTIAWATP
jgi:NADH:ubiquinone oxidoreductase subunit F (NADH-binding)